MHATVMNIQYAIQTILLRGPEQPLTLGTNSPCFTTYCLTCLDTDRHTYFQSRAPGCLQFRFLLLPAQALNHRQILSRTVTYIQREARQIYLSDEESINRMLLLCK